LLHLICRQACPIKNDGHRVAEKGAAREHIHLSKSAHQDLLGLSTKGR
jgi:hypothetical protein